MTPTRRGILQGIFAATITIAASATSLPTHARTTVNAAVSTTALTKSETPAALVPTLGANTDSSRQAPSPANPTQSGLHLLNAETKGASLVGADKAPSPLLIETLASRNQQTVARMLDLLRDRNVYLSQDGEVRYLDFDTVDTSPQPGTGGETGNQRTTQDQVVTSAAKATPDAFALHSRLGSNRVIYLDFDGFVGGGFWHNLIATPWDIDGSPTTFGSVERATIESVWARVAEDYAPLDIDVTTEEPPLASIERTDLNDTVYGTRVAVTNTPSSAICGALCGGASSLGSFDAAQPVSTNPHGYYQPAWVFRDGLNDTAKSISEAASHEAGHNLGLSHDGIGTSQYYSGEPSGIWAPIMGVGYYNPMTQFSNGSYAAATNTEDDWAVMGANGGSQISDEPLAQLTVNRPQQGVISSANDIDTYTISATANVPVTVSATPAAMSPNLDIIVTIRDPAGNIVLIDDTPSARWTSDQANGLASTSSFYPVVSGTYLVEVSGASVPAYPKYGSVGRYTISFASPASLIVEPRERYFRNVPFQVNLINGNGLPGDQIVIRDTVQVLSTFSASSPQTTVTVTLPLNTRFYSVTIEYISGGVRVASQNIGVQGDLIIHTFYPGEDVVRPGTPVFGGFIYPGDRIVLQQLGNPLSTAPTVYIPTPGAASGGISFTAPNDPGTYVLQTLENNVVIAQSNPLFVTPTNLTTDTVFAGQPFTLNIANGAEGNSNYVVVTPQAQLLAAPAARTYVSGTDVTVILRAPTNSDTYSIRYFRGDTDVLIAQATVYARPAPTFVLESTLSPFPAQAVSVAITQVADLSTGRIVIAPVGSSATTVTVTKNVPLYQFGPVEITVPSTPGTYVFRYFTTSNPNLMIESLPFTVRTNPPPSGPVNGPQSTD